MKKKRTELKTPVPKWTVSTRKAEKIIPNQLRPETVITHSLKYEGRKVHSLTGDNGLTAITDLAEEYNLSGYTPIFNSTKLLHELPAAKRKELDDLCAKMVPDLFAVESEVAK